MTDEKSKGVPTQGPTGGGKGVRDRRGRPHPNRAIKRIAHKPDPAKQPFARLGRAKPVKSAMQREIEFRAAVRGELSRIKLTSILRECPEVKFLAGVPGFRSVWQLSQASTATIQEIPGLGPTRRKKIHTYLKGKNVPVRWVP